LNRLETQYEILLSRIEAHWQSQNIIGIQSAPSRSKVSSRKLVILALIAIALVFCGLAIQTL